MKSYKMFGVMLVACAAMIVWPLLASAQKSGEPAQKGTTTGQEGKAQMKETTGGSEQTTGKMEAYKKDLEKDLRALDKKIAKLGKKMKKEGSKLDTDAKESWNVLKAKQKEARIKLKGLSSAGEKEWERRSLKPRLSGTSSKRRTIRLHPISSEQIAA